MLGTRGVPASYGGFETAVEHVGLYLVDHGWRVVVYCQEEGRGPVVTDEWRGIERVLIPVSQTDWRGTAVFDVIATRHAARHRDLTVVFGYNTAVFNLIQKLRGTPLVFNMDGIEWSRKRWGLARRIFLYANERIAAWMADHLIADHPVIEKYLQTRAPARKISMISYGAPEVLEADPAPLAELGLEPGKFLTIICRHILENSILELVEGFSAAKRGYKLVVVGAHTPDKDAYHRAVADAASDEVIFPGPIYDAGRIRALRKHSALYLHGHTVGGTNPSLVEAMGCANAVLAHDNAYNRWTAGPDAAYFKTAQDVAEILDRLLDDPAELARMSAASFARYRKEFTWTKVAGEYEALLARYANVTPSPRRARVEARTS